jgi:magnesium transporter
MAEPLAALQRRVASSTTPSEPFQELPGTRQWDVFLQFPDSLQKSVVADMSRQQLQRFLRRLDPDEATDVLELADEESREAVLRRLDTDRRGKIEFLLGFSPESAAGMMDLDYVTVDRDRSFEAVAARVRRFEERNGRFPTILVTDDGELLGELPGQTLAMTDRESIDITDCVDEIPTIRYDRAETAVLNRGTAR